MLTGIVLIGSALFLLLHNTYENQQSGMASQTVLNQIQQIIQENKPQENIEMPIVEVEGNTYIGYLTIPSLQLELPVQAELSDEKLNISPCLEKGSLQTNDLVIAGHGISNHFGNISQLNQDDAIIFTNMLGKSYTYHVVLKEELSKYQVEEMLNSDWDLTLFTCDYSGQNRITIRANRGN